MPSRCSSLSVTLSFLVSTANALGQETCVTIEPAPSTCVVASGGTAAPIILSSDEWPGVQRAAQDFATDIHWLTGIKPTVSNIFASNPPPSSLPIIIGTLGKSSLINQIVNSTPMIRVGRRSVKVGCRQQPRPSRQAPPAPTPPRRIGNANREPIKLIPNTRAHFGI